MLPFTVVSEKIQYLGVTLIKCVLSLYDEDYKMLMPKRLSCSHAVPTKACLSALGSSLSLQRRLIRVSGVSWKLLGEYIKGRMLRWIKIIGSTYTDRKVFQRLNIKSPRTPDP